MTTPKMQTQAPLTPEQIRAVQTAHRQSIARAKYLRTRRIVRIIFYTSCFAILAYVGWRVGAWDDYRNACESLGQNCPQRKY